VEHDKIREKELKRRVYEIITCGNEFLSKSSVGLAEKLFAVLP